MSEFANAHTAIRRLLDAIESYNQALRTKDLDPAVLESVIQDVNESLGDSYPKLELPHHIPSNDESQRLRYREMEAVLREAEEAIKPIARNLMRVHGKQPVDHAGVPAASWTNWVVAIAGHHRGARVWASLGGPKPQPVPFDSPYIRACLQLEYAALAEPPGVNRNKPEKAAETPLGHLGIAPTVASVLLTSWAEIAQVVNVEKRAVKSLNDRFDGPIPMPKKGGQPIVDRDVLVEWWNSLAAKAQEMSNQREGRRLSAESSHLYGKDGEVVPDLCGEVKRRRADKKR